MIYGRLESFADEAMALPENILEGLRFLSRTNLAVLPKGRIDIDGDRIFAVVQDYSTRPKDDIRPEAHASYVDLQYVVSGKESVGFGHIATAPAAIEDFIEERDVRFYGEVPEESSLILSAGSYAVFYPWDVHRPGCVVSTPEDVRKVIVKILA